MGSEIPRGVSEWHVGEGAALRMTHQTGERATTRDAPTGEGGWVPVFAGTTEAGARE